MNRIILLSVLITVLIFLGLVTFNGALLAFALPLLVLLATGFILQPKAVDLRVERRISEERVVQGTAVTAAPAAASFLSCAAIAKAGFCSTLPNRNSVRSAMVPGCDQLRTVRCS